MYTTITEHHKDFDNFKNDFINTFKNYDGIILLDDVWGYKYKKFKDYYICYIYCNNYLKFIEYFNYSGKVHRENGPACIKYFLNGKISSKEYFLNEKLHREDGPAIIEYFLNRKTYSKEYYIHGEKHREDGPAWIKYYKNGEIFIKSYWLNDKEYSYKTYLNKIKCIQQ